MSVLFMMPNWSAPSETWIQRMLEELGGDLGAVVSLDTQGATRWRGGVRAVSLLSHRRLTRYSSYFLGRLGLAYLSSERVILLREIQRPGITHVLCHYGEFAARFMDVWRKANIPLFVHFHGYDATFDIRLDEQPARRYFPDAYLTNVHELATRAVLVANSEFTKSLLTDSGIPANRVPVKYLGVPLPPVGKIHKDHEEIHVLQGGGETQ